MSASFFLSKYPFLHRYDLMNSIFVMQPQLLNLSEILKFVFCYFNCAPFDYFIKRLLLTDIETF